MSHVASIWAVEVDCPTPISKLILLLLADCHNADTGQCFPQIKTLMRKSGLGETAVKDAIRALEADKLLKREQIFHENGRTKGVQYHLNIGVAITTPPRGRRDDGKGSRSRPVGVAYTTPSKDNPEKNPEKNLSLSPAGDGERAQEFDRIWNDFPRNPYAKRKAAEQAFAKIPKAQWPEMEQAVLNFQVWYEAEVERRKGWKNPEVALPHLCNFIKQGAWQEWTNDARKDAA